MNCPNCSQANLSAELPFCPACGKGLDNKTNTDSEKAQREQTPRQKGIRQGLIFILLSLSLIPTYILLAALFPPNDTLVESHLSDTPFERVSQAILWTLFSLGVARLIYARFLQMDTGQGLEKIKTATTHRISATPENRLPLAQEIPTSGFGLWHTEIEGEEAIPVPTEPAKSVRNEEL